MAITGRRKKTGFLENGSVFLKFPAKIQWKLMEDIAGLAVKCVYHRKSIGPLVFKLKISSKATFFKN